MLKHAAPPYLDARLGQFDDPHWEPLERFAEDDAEVLGGFMWMNSIRLSDGRELQAYKHCDSRRYLRLDDDLVSWAQHPDGDDYDAYRPAEYAETVPPVFDFSDLQVDAGIRAGAQRLLTRLGLPAGRRADSV